MAYPAVQQYDITRLIIDRMEVLADQVELAEELTSSHRGTLQPFFDETTGTDSEYLTRASISHVERMRQVEDRRIQNSKLNGWAAMSLIRHVGKIMDDQVQFNSEAPPLRHSIEDETETCFGNPSGDPYTFRSIRAIGPNAFLVHAQIGHAEPNNGSTGSTKPTTN